MIYGITFLIIIARRDSGEPETTKTMVLLQSIPMTGSHLTFDWVPIIIALAIIIGLAYIFLIPFCIAHAAGKKGRSGVAWFFLSILINPFFAMLLLLIVGDTDEMRRKRAIEDERARNTVRSSFLNNMQSNAGNQQQTSDHSKYMPH